MLSRLSRWLEPNQADPQLARRQRLLNLVLLGLAFPGASFGLVMLFLWFLGTTPLTGAAAGLGVQPFYALSYWLARKGKVTLAAYIPVGAVFLAMVGGGFQLGIGHVTYVGFAMATLTASILIGNVGGVAVAVLSTLANLAIGSLQSAGRLPGVMDPVTTVTADSIGLGLGLIVLIVFTGIYSNELNKALRSQQALSAELQANQANLENLVQRRTRDLARRLVQIRTAAEISRAISAELDPRKLLKQVVDLVQQRYGLYYVGVFLLSPEGDYAVLQAGTGDAGLEMLAEGHRLAVGGPSMIGWTTFHRQPRIALDVGQEAVRFHNPHLPHTRSELALPILSGERCLGAITVQSDQANAFDQDDITMLQVVADSLAIALENARLYQQTQASLEEIRGLHRQYLRRVWSEVKRPPGELSYVYETDRPALPGSSPTVQEVPLILRDQQIGSLVIESEAASLSTEELALVQAVANETAIALENARLLEETQLRSEQLRLLQEITAAAGSHVNLAELLADVSQRLVAGFDLWDCWFTFLEPDGNSVVLIADASRLPEIGGLNLGDRIPLADLPITQQVIRTQKPAVMYAMQGVPDLAEYQGLLVECGARTQVIAPLVSQGKPIGTLGMEIADPQRRFNEEDLRLIEQIGLQISGAIEVSRMFEGIQRRADRERLITEITTRVRASTSVEVILQTAIRELAEKLHLSSGMIQVRAGKGSSPAGSADGDRSDE